MVSPFSGITRFLFPVAFHRLSRFPGRPLLALCLMLILVLGGCAANQLNTFQNRAAKGDHAWIAAQPVTCENATDVCSQLHLIKGNACLQLARAGETPAGNAACAADELELGLSLTPSWADDASHRRFQENLCESLETLQDLQTGEAAENTLARFVAASKALNRLAPESIPAVYYLAAARLRQAQPMLVDINAASRVPVCNRLKRAVTRVLMMMETARQAPPSDWNRFAGKIDRLAFDLGSALREAGCR